MKPEARLEVARNSRLQAETYFNKNNFGRSFAHFLVALNLCPEWKDEFKQKFSLTLCSWGAELESKKRFKDLFHCYEQALEIYVDSEEILNNLGAHLFRLGHIQEASHYFQKALFINPNYLPACRNLQNVSNNVVERWHFRMLNDRRRNEAFRDAIINKVRQRYDTVLDIGTGTGIFSMFAANSGARSVYACDMSPTMFQIASDVIKANNLGKEIHLFNKVSNDLNIPKDLPEKVSLVVTETMDCGLLGEHVLSTLSDAWKRLLLPPKGEIFSSKKKTSESNSLDFQNMGKREEKNQTWSHLSWRTSSEGSSQEHGMVIPLGATFCLAGIECHNLSLRYTLHSTSIVHQNLSLPGIIIAAPKNFYGDEEDPYDAEDLESLPGGFRYLVDPKEAVYVNFNDPEEIEDRLSGQYPEEILEVKVSDSGRLDAIAAWFVMNVDEDIKLTTAPGKGSCWEQALYPLYPPIDVIKGQTLQYVIKCNGKKFSLSTKIIKDNECCSTEGNLMHSIKDNDEKKENNELPEEFFIRNSSVSHFVREEPSCSNISLQSSTSHTHHQKCVISGRGQTSTANRLYLLESSVAFLNNNIWMDSIISASKSFVGDGQGKIVLDMNPFPVFGLILLKNDSSKSLVWCSNCKGPLRIQEKKSFFEIASANSIEVNRLKYESQDTLLGEFDIIFCDLMDPDGELQESMIEKLPGLLKMIKPNGLLMPKKIKVKAQLLSSKWLGKMSQVLSDEYICGYKVAEFMNFYKEPLHLELDMNFLVKDACSQPVEVLEWDVRDLAASEYITGNKVFDIALSKESSTNAIAYWYEQEILEDLWVSSFGNDTHLKQAAIIFPEEINVNLVGKVSINVIYHQSLIDFRLNDRVTKSHETCEDLSMLKIQDKNSAQVI